MYVQYIYIRNQRCMELKFSSFRQTGFLPVLSLWIIAIYFSIISYNISTYIKLIRLINSIKGAGGAKGVIALCPCYTCIYTGKE